MNFGTMIDLAVGLSLTFFILSLIASALQEIIAGVFAWRGTYLSKAVDVIMDNDPRARFAWANVKDFLRAHFTPAPGISAADALNKTLLAKPPGAITEAERTLQRVLAVQTHPLMRSSPSDLPSYVPSRNFALALLEVLRDHNNPAAPLLSQAENTVAALPDGDLRRTLSAFLQNAAGDLDKFRGYLELWFDDAMDRAGGIYRRLTQYVMIILGLLLAGALNVDTVRVTEALWSDTHLREALADAATRVQPQPEEKNPVGQIRQAMEQLDGEGLPIGWDFSAAPPPPTSWAHRYGIRAIGWIITAVAVSLGAPFWFGLLQNITNLRAAGAKPNRADDARPPGANR